MDRRTPFCGSRNGQHACFPCRAEPLSFRLALGHPTSPRCLRGCSIPCDQRHWMSGNNMVQYGSHPGYAGYISGPVTGLARVWWHLSTAPKRQDKPVATRSRAAPTPLATVPGKRDFRRMESRRRPRRCAAAQTNRKSDSIMDSAAIGHHGVTGDRQSVEAVPDLDQVDRVALPGIDGCPVSCTRLRSQPDTRPSRRSRNRPRRDSRMSRPKGRSCRRRRRSEPRSRRLPA